MYNKENFTHMFSNNTNTEYLIETVLRLKEKFKYKEVLTLEELIGLGDSWSNVACIDKLCELGYICVVNDHEVSNYRTYRNLRL